MSSGIKEQRRYRRFEFYATVKLGEATHALLLHVRNISLGSAFLEADERDLPKLTLGAQGTVTVTDGNDPKNSAVVIGRIMRKQRDGVGVQWIGDDDSFKIGGLTALHGIDFDMPEIVMASFSEAQRNRAAGSWLAAAILVRRTLEAVGRDLHPQHKNLFDCLNAMKTGGVISQEIWEWGTELRLLGNSAAHPGGDVVAAQDCEDAIHFLTAILRTLYELRPKFHAMRERRNK